MIIAIDFDGTVVQHEFPDVGQDVPGAVDALRGMIKRGHKLVLFTMRSGRFLQDAEDWFIQRDIHLSGVQYSPGQTDWTASNKCYAQVYVDDAALGAPLITLQGKMPYIDWVRANFMLFLIEEEHKKVARNPIGGSS